MDARTKADRQKRRQEPQPAQLHRHTQVGQALAGRASPPPRPKRAGRPPDDRLASTHTRTRWQKRSPTNTHLARTTQGLSAPPMPTPGVLWHTRRSGCAHAWRGFESSGVRGVATARSAGLTGLIGGERSFAKAPLHPSDQVRPRRADHDPEGDAGCDEPIRSGLRLDDRGGHGVPSRTTFESRVGGGTERQPGWFSRFH